MALWGHWTPYLYGESISPTVPGYRRIPYSFGIAKFFLRTNRAYIYVTISSKNYDNVAFVFKRGNFSLLNIK